MILYNNDVYFFINNEAILNNFDHAVGQAGQKWWKQKNICINIKMLSVFRLYSSVGPIKKGPGKITLAKSFIINGAEGRTWNPIKNLLL